MTLFAELRRRKVFRVAAAYAVMAWFLLQLADVLLNNFAAPGWVFKTILVVMLIGFPVAIFLAWAFELTPEGIKRESREATVVGRRSGVRRFDLLIGIGLILVIALMVAERAWFASRTATSATSAPTDMEGGTTKAVAVLPFVNMSSDPENEYFADGISEEILNQLASLHELRVVGRTSAFKFKGHNEDLRKIGELLGVTHILEGSVRKSDDHVRITAQLIQSTDGFHVWSNTYDRELTDIFAVQEEIAEAILESLKVSLLGDPGDHHVATTSMEAYNLYLKAQSSLAKRGSENLREARELFEEAIALDPNYPPALVGLAQTLALLPSYAGLSGEPAAEMTQAAKRAARRALELDPENAGAYAVLGTVYTFYDWRWSEAEKAFSRALELAPNDAEIANFAGDYYRAVLDPARAIEMERRALELDPLHPVNHWDLAWTYLGLGDHENAVAYARTANSLSPESLDPYAIMVWSLGALGRFDEMNEARAAARRNTLEDESRYLLLDAQAALAEGKRTEALRLQARLEPYAEAGEISNAFLGFNYLLLDESDKAAYWLRRAYERHDVQLVFPEPIDLRLIAEDPKTRVILEQPGLQELFAIRKHHNPTRSP